MKCKFIIRHHDETSRMKGTILGLFGESESVFEGNITEVCEGEYLLSGKIRPMQPLWNATNNQSFMDSTLLDELDKL